MLVFFEPLPVLDEREEREARWVDAAALEYVFGGESEEVVFEVGAALVEEDVLLHDGLLVGLVGVLVEFDRGFGLLRLGVAALDFDGVEVGDGVASSKAGSSSKWSTTNANDLSLAYRATTALRNAARSIAPSSFIRCNILF